MKWYKHFADMRFDPKIRRLISKHGIMGYGLYNAILEGIAYQLETDSPVPDLEEDAKDIAEQFKMDTIKVEEIVKYCLEEDLFQKNTDNGRIMCLKMLSHLDNTMSSNPQIKAIIDNFKKLEVIESPLKQIRLDEIKSDKSSKDKNTAKAIKHKYMEFFTLTTEEYFKLKTLLGGRLAVRDWAQRVNDWKGSKGKKTASDYHTVLSWHRREKPKAISNKPSSIISQSTRDMYNQDMKWGNDQDKAKWIKKYPNGIEGV